MASWCSALLALFSLLELTVAVVVAVAADNSPGVVEAAAAVDTPSYKQW